MKSLVFGDSVNYLNIVQFINQCKK